MIESARPVVDLNADMGEAFGVWPMGDDESLLNIVTSANSAWLRRAADAGLKLTAEAFADRAYTRNGMLVSRRLPHSVLQDPGVIAARAVRMASEGTVEADDNSVVDVAPRSICVHGDTRNAVAIARTVRRALEAAGVKIKPIG